MFPIYFLKFFIWKCTIAKSLTPTPTNVRWQLIDDTVYYINSPKNTVYIMNLIDNFDNGYVWNKTAFSL